MWAKQSTAATLIVGPILDSAGAEYTGAVIGDLSISKNGGTLTALAAAATLTHIANGQYTLVTTTGNLDTLGRAQITCNKSTYQMPEVKLMVVPAMVFDSLVLGTDVFQTDMVQIGGDTQSATDMKDLVDTGYDPSSHKVQGVVLVDTLTTYTGNTVQTGDSFARIGVNGAGLTTLATAAQIAAMTVNTRVNYQVPIEIELPDASTQIFKIRLHLFDEEGNMEAPDSTPTIALTNAAGTDRSSRLSVASNPSTGVYSWDYTATAGDAEEQLVWVFTVVEGTLTRTYPATSYVVEESAYRFSSTDRATLNAAATQTSVDDLPTNAELATALGTADDATLAAIAAEAVKTAAIKVKTDQLTFTTANKVDSTAVLDSASRAAILTQELIESYAADGAAPTVAQALMMILQHAQQKSVSATTVTIKKLDKSTTAATYTLDSATDPTSITRAT